MKEVIAKANSNAVVTVQEAKIKLAEDVANIGSWDLTGWHTILAQLTGESAKTGQDPERQRPKVGEEEEIPGDDDQSKGWACKGVD